MKEYKLKINGNDYAVSINNVEDMSADVEVNGTPFKVEFEEPVKKSAPKISRPVAKSSETISKPSISVSKPSAASAATTGGTTITSPLPGVILEVSCKEGDSVKKGQKLFVLEAMKMENVIEASSDGKVISIKVNKGDSVLEGAQLVVIG